MVEEHVGKKRRKEIRQAINMRDDKNKDLIFTLIVIAIGAVIIIAVSLLLNAHVISASDVFVTWTPMVIMLVVCFITFPRMSRFWQTRDELKKHLKRYNISKEDMKELEQDR